MQRPASETNRGQTSNQEDTAGEKLELNSAELLLETAGERLAEAQLVLTEAQLVLAESVVCCSPLSRHRHRTRS